MHARLIALVATVHGLRAPTQTIKRTTPLKALKLHGSQGSRSPLVNWYLEELNVQYEMAPPKPSDHPFGQIPYLTDGGVGVFCGSGGVEPQSETNWRYANDSKVSRVIFVNKLDRIGADFLRVVGQVEDILGANPLVMTLPIGTEDDFVGVVNLLEMKAYVWDDSGQPENYTVEDVPADMLEQCEEWRSKLIETAVEQDDEMMMMYTS